MTSFSEKQAAYAQWRARMRSGVQANQVIDLRAEDESAAELGPEWSTESLFAATAEDDEA